MFVIVFSGHSDDVDNKLKEIRSNKRSNKRRSINFADANKKVEVIIFVDKITSIEISEGGPK